MSAIGPAGSVCGEEGASGQRAQSTCGFFALRKVLCTFCVSTMLGLWICRL